MNSSNLHIDSTSTALALPEGESIETDTVIIMIDPIRLPLSLFVLEKAEVDWPKSAGELAEVKLHGRLALPVGILAQEVTPIANVGLDLAGQAGIFSRTVNFEVKGGGGEKWEYKHNPQGEGIQHFHVHWKGARFDYNGSVHLKTEFIGQTETALAVDREGATEPITLTVNEITASIDSAGAVTASLPYEIDEDGEVTLTLPFELTPDMEIKLTVGTQPPTTLQVGDYYTPGSGKFELKAKINPGSLTGASRPATLGLNLALGNEGFPGSVTVSEAEWNKLSAKEWKVEIKKK